MRRILILITTLIAGCATLPTHQIIHYQAPPPLSTTHASSWFDSVVYIDGQWNMGSGFVVGITEDHVFVMTSRHTINEVEDLHVDGNPASIHAIAPEHDLAILRVKNVGRYQKVYAFSSPTLGEEIWAIGYSVWNEEMVGLVHRGRIVSLNFRDPWGNWVVTHNAGGRGGMSGGPLLNKEGKVIGVCSFFATMGLGRWMPNASELCSVPGMSASIFWQKVQEGEFPVRENTS